MYFFLPFFFRSHCAAYRILVHQPGLKPVPLHWEHRGKSLRHISLKYSLDPCQLNTHKNKMFTQIHQLLEKVS